MKHIHLIAIGLLGVALGAPSVHAARGGAQPPYSWRGINGTGVFPAGDLVTEFWDIPEGVTMPTGKAAGKINRLGDEAKPGSRKNIVWRTLLPHWGHNAPVVMGDRVYLLCEEGWKSDAAELVCLDVTTGAILWQRPVDHLDAWPINGAQGRPGREEAKGIRAKELKRWRVGVALPKIPGDAPLPTSCIPTLMYARARDYRRDELPDVAVTPVIAAMGEEALPVLLGLVESHAGSFLRYLTAGVIHRLGKAARPVLPQIKALAAKEEAQNVKRVLNHAISEPEAASTDDAK